jgi:hypothetical protein
MRKLNLHEERVLRFEALEAATPLQVLRLVFDELTNRHGFFTAINYACCGSCGWFQITEDTAPGRLVAFTNAQSHERWERAARGEREILYFACGVHGDHDDAKDHLAHILACGVLAQFGALPAWNGDSTSSVGVHFPLSHAARDCKCHPYGRFVDPNSAEENGTSATRWVRKPRRRASRS